MRRRFVLAVLAAAVAVLLVVWLAGRRHGDLETPVPVAAATPGETQRASGDRASGVRLSGTVEAVRASTVMVPRLAGQNVSTLVVTRMARPGSRVEPGDVLIEFDPQDQLRNAMDRRAEVVDLDGQIKKRKAELAIQRASDETGLAQAAHDLERARLDLLKKEFVSPVEAEKNQLAFDQATAKLAQLKETADLRVTAGDADVRTLEIRRDRSAMALKHAEDNTKLMTVHATFSGVVVIKSTWKGNNMSEIQVGDDLRPGLPVLDVVDPSAMQVRVRINQADLNLVRPGLPATIHLDAYPDLTFTGKVELLAPLGVTSGMTAAVHFFTATVSIQGTHEKLMPDLTASVDIGAPAAAPVAAGGAH